MSTDYADLAAASLVDTAARRVKKAAIPDLGVSTAAARLVGKAAKESFSTLSDVAAAQRVKKAAMLVGKAAKESDSTVSDTAWDALGSFARRSDRHMAAVFEGVWKQLGARRSQERCRALELCARLWPRSVTFRHALLRNIPGFLRRLYGTGRSRWAKQLRLRGDELILRWHASHAHQPEYQPLDVARRYRF